MRDDALHVDNSRDYISGDPPNYYEVQKGDNSHIPTFFFNMSDQQHMESRHVKLSVIDISGREVKVLTSESFSPGHYSVTWDGRDKSGLQAPSGVYFVRMQSDEYSARERVVLLR